MSGEIIEFRVHRELHRARMYRQQPVPRPAPNPEKSDARAVGGLGEKPPSVAQQMRRIAALLEELKDLTGKPQDLPADTANQARILAKRARDVLRGWPVPVTLDDERDG